MIDVILKSDKYNGHELNVFCEKTYYVFEPLNVWLGAGVVSMTQFFND